MMVKFLFEAGLPYLALRTAIRCNNAAVIDDMYKYMIVRFRAANKFLYAKLCVLNLHTSFIMKPEIRKVWDAMRTASLRGHNGRNVAWDFTLERMNLEIATMLGHDISPGRIQEVIRQLNGIRHIRGAALNALGIGDTSELSEYNGVLDTDIGQLVQYLKLSFSIDGDNDFAKLCSHHTNQFRSEGAVAPWTRIGAVEAKETSRDYTDRMMRLVPRNNLL